MSVAFQFIVDTPCLEIALRYENLGRFLKGIGLFSLVSFWVIFFQRHKSVLNAWTLSGGFFSNYSTQKACWPFQVLYKKTQSVTTVLGNIWQLIFSCSPTGYEMFGTWFRNEGNGFGN